LNNYSTAAYKNAYKAKTNNKKKKNAREEWHLPNPLGRVEAGKKYPLRRDIQEKVRKGVEQYESGKMNSELPPVFEEVDEETSRLPQIITPGVHSKKQKKSKSTEKKKTMTEKKLKQRQLMNLENLPVR